MAKPKPWQPGWTYGTHPNPTTWHQTADVLKQAQKSKKSSGLTDRLDRIEALLKEKK